MKVETEQGKFLMYRGIACSALTHFGFKGDAWIFSGNLIESFLEIKDKSFASWSRYVVNDLIDYKQRFPEQFK